MTNSPDTQLEVAPSSPVSLTVVGSINIDVTATSRRLPLAGETVSGGVLTRSAGGKGANQAAAAARLGARTRMIGAVGDDSDGTAMLDSLQESGVDVSGVTTSSHATGTAMIMVDAAGENQISVCDGANAAATVDGVVFGADEIVLAQLEIPMTTVIAAARRCRGFFALNAAPAVRLPQELIDRADLIIVNESEFALNPALREASLVAVTYGARGAAILHHGNQTAFAPGLSAEVVSTVGAGDAFCAALTIALCSGASPAEALQTANAVGAAVVANAQAQPQLKSISEYC
ncbi:ribokinase [Brevibacterium sp. 239c]|uniref:PfkB family carbohydrate kinase n=1 Tax=Brevibacterium sp. 239c TaxID=1965356 RepID=UPI000C5669BC|nr:PfkB family carbohydrate kinase [Brevibacterium sp. 239c]SMX67822.1 ribokinase [Brevibacterium sp. 239c]